MIGSPAGVAKAILVCGICLSVASCSRTDSPSGLRPGILRSRNARERNDKRAPASIPAAGTGWVAHRWDSLAFEFQLSGGDEVFARMISETPRQRVTVRGDSRVVVEVSSGARRKATNGEAGKPAGASTVDEELRQLVLEITGDEHGPRRKVELIARWIHEHIEYCWPGRELVEKSRTVHSVLRTRRGDCVGIADFTRAMLGTAGFNTRVVLGAAIIENRLTAHAWVEAFLPEPVELDPVLDHVGVDATHIELDVEVFVRAADGGRLSVEVTFSASAEEER